MATENIGTVTCPHTGALSPVRQNATGAYYYISPAGCFTLNKDSDWIEQNADFWTDGPPADVPEWIALHKARPPVKRRPRGRPPTVAKPEPEPEPPAPVEIPNENNAAPDDSDETEAGRSWLW